MPRISISLFIKSSALLLLAAFAAACGGAGAATGPGNGGGGGGGGGTPQIASVSLSASTSTLFAGDTLRLTATARDGAGTPISGVTFTWSSSATSVIDVSSAGLATAVSTGTATVTASAGGKSDQATLTVVSSASLGALAITPAFATLDVGGTTTFTATRTAEDGTPVGGAATWESLNTAVVRIDAAGRASAVAAGTALLVARVGDLADTAAVAVTDPTTLVSTAFANGQPWLRLTFGQEFTVPIVLDLSKVSSDGDLGSAQLDLAYDADVLEYLSASPGVAGAMSINASTPGDVRISFAATQPQGSPTLTIITLTFRATGASGSAGVLHLTYAEAPTNTVYAQYSIPITVDGHWSIDAGAAARVLASAAGPAI